MTKKYKEKLVDNVYISYLSLDTVRQQIDSMIKSHGENAELRIEESYSGSYDVNIYQQVLETDQEYQDRLQNDIDRLKRKEETDRLEFERLKSKFGMK